MSDDKEGKYTRVCVDLIVFAVAYWSTQYCNEYKTHSTN